jgi:hypothetical protein
MVNVTKARRVLNDARAASLMFKAEPVDVDFRLSVVLNITLLRTVGYVIESENTGSNKVKSDEYFHKHIKNKKIFKYFIEQFRNNLVKEYASKIGWSSTTTLDGRIRFEYPIRDGVYEGKDIRKLIKSSIKFWERHLDALEKL